MTISLQKGQGVNLRKDTGFDLSRLNIGLGWDVAPSQPPYDLDAVAFLLGSNGKVNNLGKLGSNGRPTLENGDVVFYNAQRHSSGKIWLSGDNRTGSGTGDDEQIMVDLDNLPLQYQAILFAVTIFKGKELGQSFAGVKRAYIRAADAQGREICRYDIGGRPENAQHCGMTFAQAQRDNNGGWVFRAIGEFHISDRFIDILKQYLPY